MSARVHFWAEDCVSMVSTSLGSGTPPAAAAAAKAEGVRPLPGSFRGFDKPHARKEAAGRRKRPRLQQLQTCGSESFVEDRNVVVIHDARHPLGSPPKHSVLDAADVDDDVTVDGGNEHTGSTEGDIDDDEDDVDDDDDDDDDGDGDGGDDDEEEDDDDDDGCGYQGEHAARPVMSPGRLCAPLGVSAAASGGTTAGASAGTAAVRRVDFGNLGPEPVADDTVARHRDEACREGTASSPRGGSVDINTELYGVASAVESGVGSANAFAFLWLLQRSARSMFVFDRARDVLLRYRQSRATVSHVIMVMCELFGANDGVMRELQRLLPLQYHSELMLQCLRIQNAQLCGVDSAIGSLALPEITKLEGVLDGALRRVRAVKDTLTSQAIASAHGSRWCVVCQTEPRCVLLLPCRHMCVCLKCVDALEVKARERATTGADGRGGVRCPLCTAVVQGKTHVLF